MPEQEPPQPSWLNMDVLEHLVASAWEVQALDGRGAPPAVAGGLLLRNAWPPDFSGPDPGLVYIHQQVGATATLRGLQGFGGFFKDKLHPPKPRPGVHPPAGGGCRAKSMMCLTPVKVMLGCSLE